MSAGASPSLLLKQDSQSESHSVRPDILRPHGLYSPWNSPGQNTGVGSLSLLQGTFPTQGSHPDLPHCRRILYQLSHQGSPRALAWAACPFSRGSAQPRDGTRVACTSGGFFTSSDTKAAGQPALKSHLWPPIRHYSSLLCSSPLICNTAIIATLTL